MKFGKQIVRAWIGIVLAGGVLAAAYSGRAETVTVQIGDYFFSPTNITINVGDTVVWTNRVLRSHDTAQGVASTPDAQRLWKSPNLPALTGNFRFTFTTPGVFRYLCLQHATFAPQQTGTVSVIGNFPPSVSINAPASGTRHPLPAGFDVAATASDPDGVVTNVEFLAFSAGTGTVSMGSDTTAPFAVPMASLPPSSYQLRAVATDDGGTSVTSAVVNIQLLQPVPLLLTSPAVVEPDKFQFDMATTFGLTYIVEATPDVTGTWLPVSTNTATGAVYRIVRPYPGPISTQTFFRAFIRP